MCVCEREGGGGGGVRVCVGEEGDCKVAHAGAEVHHVDVRNGGEEAREVAKGVEK